jgi:hypothetical protein
VPARHPEWPLSRSRSHRNGVSDMEVGTLPCRSP